LLGTIEVSESNGERVPVAQIFGGLSTNGPPVNFNFRWQFSNDQSEILAVWDGADPPLAQ
jgi:hypothetical protein